MQLTRWVLWASALAYGGVGLAFLVAPQTMGAAVDLSLESATADNDVRAVYGGTGVGLAVFLVAGAARPGWHRPALFVVIATLASMASARFLSWAIAGAPGPIGYVLHGAEITGLVLGIVALRRLGRSHA